LLEEQLAQELELEEEPSPPELLAENVETRRLTLPEAHVGQTASSARLIVVSSSKRRSQGLQRYS